MIVMRIEEPGAQANHENAQERGHLRGFGGRRGTMLYMLQLW